MKSFVFVIFSLAFGLSIAQSTISLEEKENELSNLLSQLRNEIKDSYLKKTNEQFKAKFLETLELEGAFDYPFSQLTSVGKIYSKDELIRVISWNVQYEDFSYDYFSFILKKDSRKGKVFVTELNRQKQNLYMGQFEKFGAENWYGALYYEIIDVQRRNRTYYTLLGFDANNERSKIKLIDALYFTGKTPNFGAPIFDSPKGKVNRLIYEYNAEANMSMKFDPSRDKIIMDHLSPEHHSMNEFREFYVPDMSYDALVWNGTMWKLEEDIIAINKENKTIKLKAYDAELDTVVDIPTQNKWINPEDPNSPIDGGTHRAIVPDDIKDTKNKKRKKEKVKKAKKEKEPKNSIPGVTSFKKDKKKGRKKIK